VPDEAAGRNCNKQKPNISKTMRLLPVRYRVLVESLTNTSPDVKRPDEQGEIPRWSGHL